MTTVNPATGAKVSCPHCQAANSPSASFCVSCGKALPTLSAGGPRLVTDIGASSAARGLISDELQKQTKKAATCLMWVAIIQTVLGGFLLLALSNAPADQLAVDVGVLSVVLIGIAVAFWVLYFWARRSPLPAAIVGLVLFITLHVLDALADPTALARGWLVKIIVIVVLSKAISAGLKYKRLKEQEQLAI